MYLMDTKHYYINHLLFEWEKFYEVCEPAIQMQLQHQCI